MAVTVKIVTDALQDPEVQKLAKWLAVDGIKRLWKRIFGRNPTRKDEKEIRQIVRASMDDVHRYDPKIEAIERRVLRRNPLTVREKRAFVKRKDRRTRGAAKRSKRKRN